MSGGILDTPGINRHIEMLNSGFQPDPEFSVFCCFQYQNNPCLLFGLNRIIDALPCRFRPVIAKIKLNRMGIKIENEDAEAPINLDIDEYHSADGRTAIAVPVRIPFNQIPDKPDFLSQASRYL